MIKKFIQRFGTIALLTISMIVTHNAIADNNKQLDIIEQKNEQLVRDFMASLAQKDMKKVASYLSDDFSFQNAMKGKREFGKKTFTDWWFGMVGNATKLKPKIIRINVIGNTVIFENTFYYQDKENEMTFKGAKFVNIKNGKITEYQEYKLPKI